jgi:hypothetical protein
MKLIEVSKNPAIVDIEIPELESFDFESYFCGIEVRFGFYIIPISNKPSYQKYAESFVLPSWNHLIGSKLFLKSV